MSEDALRQPARRRVRTPTVLQMEALECGAASLAMVLAYHGCWVPLEELRHACGVSRDGSKASNVVRAARGYGLLAKGFKKEPDQLMALPVPSIIHWNFNHYLVFEGIRDGRAYLNDPMSGPRSVTLEELDVAFTGVVLAFAPGPEFRRQGQPPRVWRELAGYLGQSRDGLVVVAAASVLLVLPGIVVPGLSKLFVDQVLLQRLETWLAPLCLAMAVAALMQGALTWLQQSHLVRLQAKLSIVLSVRYLARLVALPQRFTSQRNRGELANRVAGIDRVAQLLSGELATSAFHLVAVLFYAGAMAAFDPLLAVVALAMMAVNLAALRAAQRRRTDLNRKLVGDLGRLQGATVSAIATIETLKVSGTDNDAFVTWSGHQAQALSSQQELGLLDGLLAAVPTFLAALATTAILGIGGWRVIDGELSVGSLIAIQALMASLMGPVNSLVGLGGRLQAAEGDLERLSDVMRSSPRPPPAAVAGLPAKLDGRVELRNLTFGYNPCEPPLLEGFSLSLAPGARVALVGASGSGKSTVGRLLCGLEAPWSGEVLIDGHAIDTIPPGVFANSVAYVDQDIFLFEGSIRDNLTLWDPTIGDGVLIQALKDAEIHADVSERPGGTDGEVAEGGGNFSGGQRQRLEIARALVANPSILVLDEATAALDPVTEKTIDDNIRRRGCTCLIIAHRLSTIRDCDEIIVLRQGRAVERGSHDDLMERGGLYAELIRAGR